MLESSGRTLLVLLSLLAGTWSSSVSAANQIAACSTGFPSTFEAGPLQCSVQGPDAVTHPCDCGFAAAAGLLKPPAASIGTSSSSYLQSLPVEPKSMLMALVGFLCVSLVHDRKLWLTAVASIVSFSHDRPPTASSISPDQRDKRRLHGLVSCDASLYGARQVPPCLWRRYMPLTHADGWKNPGVPSGVLNPQSFNRSDFLPTVALVMDGSGCPSSQVAFAQLARGPPP